MNRIVHEHYPVEKLPKDLRSGLIPGSYARVLIEAETPDQSEQSPSNRDTLKEAPFTSMRRVLAEIKALRESGKIKPSDDAPSERIRKLRDEWNG